MTHKKHWIAALLCLLLLLSVFPASVFAEDIDIDLVDVDGGEDGEAITEEELSDDLIAVVEGDDAWIIETGSVDYQPVEREYGRLLLDVDWSLIEQVEHQNGGQACACYALAYCRTLLDGVPHQYSEYNIGTVERAWCSWVLGDYDMRSCLDLYEAYDVIYQELCSGNPVIACVSGSRATQHYIAIVGFENAVSGQPLSANNFLIIDSIAPRFQVENMGAVGYDLKLLSNGCYQLDCDTTEQSVSFEAHASSYLSRCRFTPSHRSLTLTKSAALQTLPCPTAASADSRFVAALPVGSAFTAYAIVENAAGEYWYKGRSAAGREGYVYAGYVSEGTALYSDISVSDPELPLQQRPGEPFSLRGRLRAAVNEFSAVSAWVYAGADTASTRLTGGEVYPDLQYYSLDQSELSERLRFRELRTGCYTFVLAVKCRSYFSTDGKTLQYSEEELPLITHGFTVGKVASYLVRYDANGGSGAPGAQVKVKNYALTLSDKTPTRSGYRFVGWAADRNADAARYLPGEPYQTNEPLVLYAVWQPCPEPTIVSQPKSVTAALGSAAKFAVKASGEDLRYQWFYRASFEGSWHPCTGAGAATASYSPAAGEYRDGYCFRCAVSNDAGTVYSGSAMLTVVSIPR